MMRYPSPGPAKAGCFVLAHRFTGLPYDLSAAGLKLTLNTRTPGQEPLIRQTGVGQRRSRTPGHSRLPAKTLSDLRHLTNMLLISNLDQSEAVRCMCKCDLSCTFRMQGS